MIKSWHPSASIYPSIKHSSFRGRLDHIARVRGPHTAVPLRVGIPHSTPGHVTCYTLLLPGTRSTSIIHRPRTSQTWSLMEGIHQSLCDLTVISLITLQGMVVHGAWDGASAWSIGLMTRLHVRFRTQMSFRLCCPATVASPEDIYEPSESAPHALSLLDPLPLKPITYYYLLTTDHHHCTMKGYAHRHNYTDSRNTVRRPVRPLPTNLVRRTWT